MCLTSLPRLLYCQLSNTKDAENKTTLLHYLAEVVEAKHGELIEFPAEIAHVPAAAKVSTETSPYPPPSAPSRAMPLVKSCRSQSVEGHPFFTHPVSADHDSAPMSSGYTRPSICPVMMTLT